ncbi:hypothetical protein [Chryseobacterium indoltheticum]|uniref:hypothetical protein n=1 Tax=Chryseobacterium indoltheticum TaxID=254 RepID=UPI003F4953C7
MDFTFLASSPSLKLNFDLVRIFIIENLNSLKKRDFFKSEVIDEWWNNQKNEYDCVKIWQLVTFELWYQKYFENH